MMNRKHRWGFLVSGILFFLAQFDFDASASNITLPLQGVNEMHSFQYELFTNGYQFTSGNEINFNLVIDSITGYGNNEQGINIISRDVVDEATVHFNAGNYILEYLNTSEGLRQNFILNHPKENLREQKIYITIYFDGNINFDENSGIIFYNNTTPVYTYNGLKSWDNNNNPLKSKFELISHENGIIKFILSVNSADAMYPVIVDPNIGLFDAGLYPGQNSAKFGRSLCNAGDVNHDGFEDIVVGAYYYDNGQTNEGRAYLYYGSTEGIITTPVWTFENNQASAQTGYVVRGGKDVNNDGYTDLLISSNLFDNGQTDEGIVYLFLGNATGFSTTPSWTFESNNATATLGNSIDFAGDVNNDGFEDVIVGAMNYDMAVNEGKVFVFYGNASGLPLTPNWEKFGYASSRYMGTLVSAAGDINNDGFDDVAIVEKISTYTHRVYVFNGSATGLNATYSWNKDVPKKPTDIIAGDLNNDGIDDLVIGCPDENEGTIYQYNGSPTGLSLTLSWTKHGRLYYGELGYGLAIGDANNDGFNDLAANDCILKLDAFDDYYHEVVNVYYGTPTGVDTIHYYSVERATADYSMGRSLDFADYNGDGFPDLVIGDPESTVYTTFSGGVYLVNSSSIGLFGGRNNFFYADQDYAEFGDHISTGDINGDGYSDMIVSADGYLIDGFEGATFIMYGGEKLLQDFLTTPKSDSTWATVKYGDYAICVGDVNGDGFDDVGVSDMGYTMGESHEGIALVYAGSPTGIITTPLWQNEGNLMNAYYGEKIVGGDFNNDGYSDLVVDRNIDRICYSYPGSATGPSLTPTWMYDAEGISNMTNVGDFNGDNYQDLVLGYGYYDGSVGQIILFLGSLTGLSNLPSAIYTAPDNVYYAGDELSAAGDLNGDGYDDFISGSYHFENGDPWEGALYIFYGSLSGSISDPVIIESNEGDLRLGSLVSNAGDVNADGYADHLVLCGLYNDDVRLYYGSEAGLDTSYYVPMDEKASTLSSIGDVNADGYSDFAIGYTTFHPYGNIYSAGSILIYYGNINVNNGLYCHVPTGVEILTITPGNAFINWDNSPDISEYTIKWKKTADALWNYDTVTSSIYNLTSLENCSTYQYAVRTNCSPYESGWSAINSFSSYCSETCDSIAALNIDSVVLGNIYLNWDPVAIGESYLIDYKKSTAATWTTISSIASSVIITGATYCTDYQFRIRTVCSSDTSGFSAILTTESYCTPCYGPPDELYATNITSSSAKLHWDADPLPTNYKLYYRKTGTVTWTKKNSTTNVKKITGLLAATSYDYKVKTECAGGVQTTFSDISTFTTLPLKADDIIIAPQQIKFTVFPNPTSGDFSVLLNEKPEQPVSILITDITGKEIYRAQYAEGQNYNFNLDIPSGAYFIQLTIQDKNQSDIIIIQ